MVPYRVRTDDNDNDGYSDDNKDEWTNFSIQQWNNHEYMPFVKFQNRKSICFIAMNCFPNGFLG